MVAVTPGLEFSSDIYGCGESEALCVSGIRLEPNMNGCYGHDKSSARSVNSRRRHRNSLPPPATRRLHILFSSTIFSLSFQSRISSHMAVNPK